MKETFKEYGLKFDFSSNCITCIDGRCHNTISSSIDCIDYNLTISTNRSYSNICIQIVESANTVSSNDKEFNFNNEKDAIVFLNENYPNFKCM